MLKLFYPTLLIFSSFLANAQCTEVNTPKVLLVGDSWAFFMNVDGTINKALDACGHSNYTFVSNGELAVNGARAEDFLTVAKKNEIEAQLNANPTIEVVHISLGGNDFLGDWKVSYTPAETEALKAETKAELLELFDFIQGVKPGIQIVWSGYMYANFEEIISEAPDPTAHPFYSNWENMEFPTFEQLNTVLNEFAGDVIGMADTVDYLDYVHAPALMQWYFGQSTPLSVAPGGSYPAFSQPLPEGDILYPSPKISMRNYGLFLDCFHLSPAGYFQMMAHQTLLFYQKFLMDDLYLIPDVQSNNGALGSTGTVYLNPKLGDSSGVSFQTLLSFDTSVMPDTSLGSASIFLRREGLIGSNFIGSSIILNIKTGNFGGTAALESDDWADDGDFSFAACVFGEKNDDGDWLRIDLPETALPFISNTGITQFKILSDGSTDDQFYFSGLDSLELAPVLNLRYKYIFAEAEAFDANFTVYPNPVGDIIQLQVEGITSENAHVTIFNTNGQVVYENQFSSQINVQELPKGTYFILMEEGDQRWESKFVKL